MVSAESMVANMKGVLLAGGYGTRLLPATKFLNKHLFPIVHNGKVTPIIEFGIQALKEAGITDVAVVLGDFRCEDIFSYLKDGSQYGMHFEYFWQGNPLGIAHAVYCANEFLSTTEDVIVYLGDNIFENGIVEFVENTNGSFGCLFAKVKDNKRFGVPRFTTELGTEKLDKIIEKPKVAPSEYALTGCYHFHSAWLQRHFPFLKQSARGEYELTDLINLGLKGGFHYYWKIYDGWWCDAGTPESITKVQKLLEMKK